MSRFIDKVIETVAKIPPGTVVSYGQVALYIGAPRAARQVGWVLNKHGGRGKVPWWRVVNNRGRITIKGSVYTPEDQRQLLLTEGVEVSRNYELDIEKYRFRPSEEFIKRLSLDGTYLEQLRNKL